MSATAKGSLRNRRIVLSSSGHLLLDAGVDPKARDHKRRTAWDLVRERFTPEQLTAMVAENPEVGQMIARLKTATGG